MLNVMTQLLDGFHRYGKRVEKIFVPNYVYMGLLSEMVEKLGMKPLEVIPDELDFCGVRVIWIPGNEMKVVFEASKI